jgi:exodeoxyribonuclease VII small subunit
MGSTPTYKELSDELAQVVHDLEQGDLDVDEAVKCYERGLQIIKELEAHLKNAENKVAELKASILDDAEEE